jgi:hypothetical protein
MSIDGLLLPLFGIGSVLQINEDQSALLLMVPSARVLVWCQQLQQ